MADEINLSLPRTTGLALPISYRFDTGFGPAFTLVNLPFFLLAAFRMDLPFTARTVGAVALLSVVFGRRAGWVQLGLDASILLLSLIEVSPTIVAMQRWPRQAARARMLSARTRNARR